MKLLSKGITLSFLAVAAITESPAQSRKQVIKARIDSALSARYYKTPYDTNYVVRPEGKVTLKLRLNQTGNSLRAKGTVNDIYSEADLETSHKTTVSIGATYRGISAALAINPAKLSGSYKDYELNLNYYSSRISADFSYQRSESLAGDIEMNDRTGTMESGDLSMKVVNLAVYYTFNHRHFSFPAAFTQSYIQRRSAGSWLAGISYQGGVIDTTDDLKARKANAPDLRIDVGHIGIGGGYGFNWVPGKRWLLHISALPTFVVYNRNKMTINDVERKAQHIRFNMIFNERAAIVYNFSPRYFAGVTLTMNNSIFDDNVVQFKQNKWRGRAFLGGRL